MNPNIDPKLQKVLGNPAALQRTWRSVVKAVKNEKIAFGVVLSNVHVSVNAQGTGVAIEFADDNPFAYQMAQKAEVQDAVAAAFKHAAGVEVPFTMMQKGEGASATEPANEPSPEQRGRNQKDPAAPEPRVERRHMPEPNAANVARATDEEQKPSGGSASAAMQAAWAQVHGIAGSKRSRGAAVQGSRQAAADASGSQGFHRAISEQSAQPARDANAGRTADAFARSAAQRSQTAAQPAHSIPQSPVKPDAQRPQAMPSQTARVQGDMGPGSQRPQSSTAPQAGRGRARAQHAPVQQEPAYGGEPFDEVPLSAYGDIPWEPDDDPYAGAYGQPVPQPAPQQRVQRPVATPRRETKSVPQRGGGAYGKAAPGQSQAVQASASTGGKPSARPAQRPSANRQPASAPQGSPVPEHSVDDSGKPLSEEAEAAQLGKMLSDAMGTDIVFKPVDE